MGGSVNHGFNVHLFGNGENPVGLSYRELHLRLQFDIGALQLKTHTAFFGGERGFSQTPEVTPFSKVGRPYISQENFLGEPIHPFFPNKTVFERTHKSTSFIGPSQQNGLGSAPPSSYNSREGH